MRHDRIYCEDCLVGMGKIPDGKIDMVLTDLPYGITSNKWDCEIDLVKLWAGLLRVTKESAAFVFTSGQPFTAKLVSSQIDLWRHEWIWIKNRGSNFANTVREPFKEHETVQVFSRGKWTYNAQFQRRTGSGRDRIQYQFNHRISSKNYRPFEGREGQSYDSERVPSSWQVFETETGSHPTQKPITLFEYLIRTYSNKGNLVLDTCMGSATTALACMQSGRSFIGFENDPENFKVAQSRIRSTIKGFGL